MTTKSKEAFRGKVTAIPEGKGTPEEHKAMRDFYSGDDNLYSPGIRVGQPGAYDPEKGSERVRNERPEVAPTPLLVTDPGQPRIDSDRVAIIDRKTNPTVDKTERPVVKSTGRKATTNKE